MRLPDQTVQLLRQLGILTLGQMAAVPRAGWLSRFGSQLLQRWDQATGVVPEMIVAHRPPPPLEFHWTLEHPTVRRDVIQCVLAQLVERLSQRMAQRNQGVIQLRCQLDCACHRPAHIEIGLFRATATAEHLLELIQMQLQQLALPGPLQRISLRAITTAALVEQQRQLLDDSVQDVPRELARLVNRLSSRLGRWGVVEARLEADAQVEYAYRYVPLTGQSSRDSGGASATRSSIRANVRCDCTFPLCPWRPWRWCPWDLRCPLSINTGPTALRSTGGPNASKPAGGAAPPCGATTTASRTSVAAAFGCSAG